MDQMWQYVKDWWEARPEQTWSSKVAWTAGGVLCVGVPNDFSPFQIAARSALDTGDWWVAPPHHLNYFDFDSLQALLVRLGVTIAERTTSFPMEAFAMMGEDYTRDATLGRDCHNRRKRFDFAFETAGLKETRREFYRALATLGECNRCVVHGRNSRAGHRLLRPLRTCAGTADLRVHQYVSAHRLRHGHDDQHVLHRHGVLGH